MKKVELLKVIKNREMIKYIINYLNCEAKEMDSEDGSSYQDAKGLMESFDGDGFMFVIFQDILMDSITLEDKDEKMFSEVYDEINEILFA